MSVWYGPPRRAWPLWPLSGLYALAAALHRLPYRLGWRKVARLPVPVIVVGNLTVGGTGKTPLVIHLARALAAQGERPGILCRGYGGRARQWPQRVRPDSDPVEVGDEPVLIAQRTGAPVLVSTPDLLDYVPQATWLPVVVDVRVWRDAAVDPPLQRERPVVVHAPSNAGLKGSELIGETLRALDAEGVPYAAGEPMRASEDFGRFGQQARAAMFLLGAGERHPSLHNPDYDFPDELIPIGAAVLMRTLRLLLG